jgi:type IV pilus assembly protein PilV
MLEVLVSLLIMSFGLLGLAGMRLNNIKNNQNSGVRSIATQQAYDMADRMRANRAGFEAGNYNGQQGTSKPACFTTAGCTAQEMAQADAYMWNELNAAALPAGRGYICVDSTPNDGTPLAPACDGVANSPYVIKVWWDERQTGGALTRFVTTYRD